MMTKPQPGVRYHAAIATSPGGEMALAIAHMGPDGPVLDEIRVRTVAGGEAGIDAVYRGLREQGISVVDHRNEAGTARALVGDIRSRAIADAFTRVRAH
jgi:hypothetical protein